MTTSIKKEISALIEEVLEELGQVDHRIPGTKPIHTGFAELPISPIAQEHMNLKVEEAYNLIEKALANLDHVVAEMESNGHHPGNLLLIADQVELVADGLAEHLNIDNQPDEPEEKDLEEAKRRKRKKCQCADGKKRSRCCRKRLRKPRHYYWFGYGMPYRRFYGGYFHHHPPPPPTPPPPSEPPPEGSDGSGSGEPPTT